MPPASVAGGANAIEFFLDPLWGNAADLYGRKPIALMAVCGTFIQLVTISAWPSVGGVIIAFVVRGLTSVLGAMVYAMVRGCVPATR